MAYLESKQNYRWSYATGPVPNARPQAAGSFGCMKKGGAVPLSGLGVHNTGIQTEAQSLAAFRTLPDKRLHVGFQLYV